MLNVRDASFLLDDLCISLGFCLSPSRRAALLAASPANPDAFVEAVIRAEGVQPDTIDHDLF